MNGFVDVINNTFVKSFVSAISYQLSAISHQPSATVSAILI